jgi:hypothetical protein
VDPRVKVGAIWTVRYTLYFFQGLEPSPGCHKL